MIRALVQSAFKTGCLSVASEGLIRQVLHIRAYQSDDLEALEALQTAVSQGQIRRESRWNVTVLPLGSQVSYLSQYRAS